MCMCALALRHSQVFITHFCFPSIAASGFILLRFFFSSRSWLCLRLALGAQSWTQPFDYLICVCSCVACFHTGWLNVSQRNLHIQSIKHLQWKAFWSTLKQPQYDCIQQLCDSFTEDCGPIKQCWVHARESPRLPCGQVVLVDRRIFQIQAVHNG